MSMKTFRKMMVLIAILAVVTAMDALFPIIAAFVSKLCPRSEGCAVLMLAGINYGNTALFVAWLLVIGIASLLRLPKAGFSRCWTLGVICLAILTFPAFRTIPMLMEINNFSPLLPREATPLLFLIGLVAYFCWFKPAPGEPGGTRGNRLAWSASRRSC